MSRDENYLAEYAKSGRSQCRTCRNVIEKNTLRLAEVVNNEYGKNTEWHHFVCFWKKNHQFTTKDCARAFGGFWKLTEEDKKKLREHFRYGRGPVPRVERKDADSEDCAKCAETLPAGSLQLTHILTVYHPQCFANMEDQNWTAVESFDGFGSLTNEEQETIKEIFKSAADAKAAK
ncbi:hypothetical protein AAVH_25723 [Aphelenchoides avenae]|nr:hypothetical protein AAVH_25723 [Aphelenchus avenae]